MKNIKLFVGITTIFALMMMLVGCDVFNGNGRWGLPGKDSGYGKIYDAFAKDPKANDKGLKDAPDPDALISLRPNSRFVFLPESVDPYNPNPTGDIYVVIPKTMTLNPGDPSAGWPIQSLDKLYALIGGSAIASAIASHNGKTANTVTGGVPAYLKTIEMDYSTTHPVTGETSSSGYFYIKIAADMALTGANWYAGPDGDPVNGGVGVRVEFTNDITFHDWDEYTRLVFGGHINAYKGFATMGLTTNEMFDDPFISRENNFITQIRLDFGNKKSFFKPRVRDDKQGNGSTPIWD